MSALNKIIATVVIPANGRVELTQRAIDSVVRQVDSDLVQIIVVDDASEPALNCLSLRDQDSLLRNATRRGAAVSRNRGIDVAKGDIIYLLDSDDEFIERQFRRDHAELAEFPGILYSAIRSGRFSSDYPCSLSRDTYLSSVFGRYRFVAQTSSLCFTAAAGYRFDESLPKHQDWDFVFNALRRNASVRHGPGRIHFDRSDKISLSRSPTQNKSALWIEKLREIDRAGDTLEIDPDVIEAFLNHGKPGRRNPFTIEWARIVLSSNFTVLEKIKFVIRSVTKSLR